MNKPPDILSAIGATYSGRIINDWIRYHFAMNTEFKRVAIDFIRCYGVYGVDPNRMYRVLLTSDFPKSAKSNGNRDGDYLLKRVGRTHIKFYCNRSKLYDENVFYF